ncbi:unnamed protein product, partial [Adineta ricciae]
TNVPDDILRYTRTLEDLLLDANQLQDLPKGVYRLIQLRRLTFSDNEIQYISPEIGQLVNLEELDCSRNDIAEIPENIRHCRSLQRLDCSGNPLANNLPPGIIHLRQLSQLTLNDVSLAELPREIGSLNNLRILEVRENLLKILPDSLVNLTKLESLDLGSNVIEQLPPHMSNLQSLKELWLDSNEILELPHDIGRLKRLQCLDISENKLTYLPDDIGDLESLTNLELSSNQIEHVPSTIGQLSQRLLILKINSNSLAKLCDEIGNCLALTELILTENALSELPSTIGNLKHLTNLNVDRNQLTYLPYEIAGCESLGMLSLRDNRLTQVPSELSNLKHLHVLDLSGNRLLNLPCTLLECDLKAIWLAENQAQPMLKFATDIDPTTGEKVLTCYLLPQQQYTTSSMENLLNASKSQSLNNESINNRLEQEDIEEFEDRHERTGSVKFADQSDEAKESSLQRHNTPHPKDLRTWRNKVAKKFHATDGNLLHHDHQHPFQPNAHPHDAQRNSIQPSTSSGQSTSSAAHPNRTVPDSITFAQESMEYIPPEISTTDRRHSDDEDDENTGEQVQYIEKHVEFTDNVNDEENTRDHQQQQKLHRRDTPHHLKNKRVLNKNNDSVNFDHIMSHSSTKSSLTSPGKDSRSSSIPTNSRQMTIHQEQLTIMIRRPLNTGLGISIAGGIGSTPYKDNDYGIFLTKINDDGPAGQAGLLVGDKLVSVNGISLINCEHSEAVSALKKAGDNIEMIVMREILQSSDDYNDTSPMKEGEKFSTTVQRDEKQGGQFGFAIAGGNQSTAAASPSTVNGFENLYISKVNKAESNSPLAVGDRLLSINGYDTGNITHDQAINIINNGGSNVDLVLYREKYTNGNHHVPTGSTGSINNTIEEARVTKGNGPMGLSIVGGVDQACPPFGMDQRGVFVSKILPNGSASRTNLRIGDRILKVNNRDVSQATHLEAVEALLQPTTEVVLLVRHDPQPAGLRDVTLTRQTGEPLGIRINGGVDGKRVNPDDSEDDGIFVTEVKDGSPASGILNVGTRILEAMNKTYRKQCCCVSQNSVSSCLSTPTDEPIYDYCETNLDDLAYIKRTLLLNKSARKLQRGHVQKRKAKRKRLRSCCFLTLCQQTKKNMSEQKQLTLTQQIVAPIVTLKDLISVSSSSSCSSTDTKRVRLPKQQSIVSQSSMSTPKSLFFRTYTSLSNYLGRSNLRTCQPSVDVQIHHEEFRYCSSNSSLSIKTDPNQNDHLDEISLHSLRLLHAVDMYLSSNSSLYEHFDSTSVVSEKCAILKETDRLSLCEINEIICAIHSTSEDVNERNETLDALASSLLEVAEEIPVILPDDQIENIVADNLLPPPAPEGVGQILARAVMYEIVNNQSLFGARLDDAQKWLSVPSETIHLLICHGFKPKEIPTIISPSKPSKQIENIRPPSTQQSSSPIPPTRQNGVSSPHNNSNSSKVISPIYANTTSQPLSPQPPPVPAKPKYRSPNAQFAPINGDNYPTPKQAQNGFEVEESDISVTESERSFKDKKKFFESGLQAPGPKPKPRQFKYINEHELFQMKQEDEQKVKTMTPTEILQSRSMYDNDTEIMQTTLSQYQTPAYLAKPEDDQTDDDMTQQRNSISSGRMNPLERDTTSAHTMLSNFAIADSGMA